MLAVRLPISCRLLVPPPDGAKYLLSQWPRVTNTWVSDSWLYWFLLLLFYQNNTGITLSRVHTSDKAADVTKLFLLDNAG